MIKVQIKNNEKFIDMAFPCSENMMAIWLEHIGIKNPNSTKVFVSNVIEPNELSFLKNRILDLDELNYLAKRMDSFFGNEELQFYEALKLEHFTEMKDLINLSFNLKKYALITDIGDMSKVGQEYLLNKNGSIPAYDENNPKYAEIGRQLLQSGQGVFTDYGLLFSDNSVPFEEIYNGQTFPAYLYNQCYCVGEIEYEGKLEYVYLPDDVNAINKALRRLGTDSIENCNVTLCDFCAEYQPLFDAFNSILESESLYAVNDLARAVEYNIKLQDLPKLSAVMEYADVCDAKSIIALAENLKSFEFVEDVEDNEELAQRWIENQDDLHISIELTDYFDFDQYGGDIVEDYNGKFIEGIGFVCMSGCECLDDILYAENEDIGMGGM